MRKGIVVLFIMCCTLTAYSQTFKWSNGIAISSMREQPRRILKENLVSYAGFIGCDYWTHTYYYLSSEIGFLQMGGKEALALYNFKPVRYKEYWNYLHLNTTFRVKYPYKKMYVYAGVGPKADILVGNNHFRAPYFKEYDYQMKKIIFGSKMEVGITGQITRTWEIGLNAAYLLNFNKAGKSEISNFNEHIFLLTCSVGYVF